MINTVDNCEKQLKEKVDRLIEDGRLVEEPHVFPSLLQLIETEFAVIRMSIYNKGCTCYTGVNKTGRDAHCVVHEDEKMDILERAI